MSALQKFYRTPKLFVPLPSGTDYYDESIIEYTSEGEVGILPMTVHDEMALKNPDALLNGEAISNVLLNCVPKLKSPRQLLSIDTEALITAIRIASFGETTDVTFNCPACSKDTTVALNLKAAFQHMKYLPATNVVHLPSGLSVFLKPSDFEGDTISFKISMESKRLIAEIAKEEDNSPDRTELVKRLYDNISKYTVTLLVRSITRIVCEKEGVDVSDKQEIAGFLDNTSSADIKLISDKVKEINSLGLTKKYSIKCKECEHVWDDSYEYSISNFFTNS